jgi:tRNA threonylcarbamoyladenosine biosynthesis protein TsaB
MLLAIDTSTRYAGVALADEGRVLSARCWYSSVNHTTELMPAVSDTLTSRGLTPRDLEGIAIALGPGGFSALRVGMSAAKGLALAAKIPLVGLSTLELEAFPYLESGVAVVALLDAGRKEVASARFGADGQRVRDDIIGAPGELVAEFTGPTLFCGEGVLPWAGLIKERLGPLAVVVMSHWSPASRLWSLAELGQRKLAAGEIDDLVALQPYYLRMPSIGGPKRRDWVPQQS